MAEYDIPGLAKRVKAFLDINNRVNLTDLKFHLRCRGSDLLIAAGWLLKDGFLRIEKDRMNIWIIKNNEPG